MSGLEALGAAAAIAQFMQYGIQFLHKVVEVYKSAEGTTDRLDELQRTSEGLRDFADDFSTRVTPNLGRGNAAEVELQRIAHACQAETAALLALMDDLQVRGTKNVFKSVKTVIKVGRHKADFGKHERRLERLQNQLHAQLLKLIHTKNGDLEKSLIQMHDHDRDMETRLLQHFSSFKRDLLAAISKSSGREDTIIQLLRDMKREGEQVVKRQAVLASLKFSAMHSRYDSIAEPSASTYGWVYQPDTTNEGEQVNFVPWLQRDSGIFWVTGKAGSGKSTLMKYISQDARTSRFLRSWAGRRDLFTTSYYFWNTGDFMQKSQQGLLQSILYNILSQCPSLIDQIRAELPDDVVNATPGGSGSVWTLSALRKSIDAIANIHGGSGSADHVCFCFFIDGLDEYHGDHEELAKFILAMDRSTNIKLCVSSRPWEVYRAAFDASVTAAQRLQVHLHTRKDIEAVAHQELDHLVRDRDDDRDDIQCLVTELVHKAEGVFLWVTLVIRELVKGFRHADTVHFLRERLNRIPPGLDEYFHHILRGIEGIYKQSSARIFLCTLQVNLEWLPLQAFSYLAGEGRGDIPAEDPRATYSDWNSSTTIQRMRKQLNGRCLDLLQIIRSTSSDRPYPVVQFLHRTVRDFLENADVTTVLQAQAGPDFDPAETLCQAFLVLLPTRVGNMTPRWKLQWAHHVFSYAQDLEFQSGRTMSASLHKVCRDMALSFRRGFLWSEQLGNVLGPRSYRIDDSLQFMVRLGLIRNFEESADRKFATSDISRIDPKVSQSYVYAVIHAFRMLECLWQEQRRGTRTLLGKPNTPTPQLAHPISIDFLVKHFVTSRVFVMLESWPRTYDDLIDYYYPMLRHCPTDADNELRESLKQITLSLIRRDGGPPVGIAIADFHARLRAVFGASAADEIISHHLGMDPGIDPGMDLGMDLSQKPKQWYKFW